MSLIAFILNVYNMLSQTPTFLVSIKLKLIVPVISLIAASLSMSNLGTLYVRTWSGIGEGPPTNDSCNKMTVLLQRVWIAIMIQPLPAETLMECRLLS
mgnify:CR=1 FL=1